MKKKTVLSKPLAVIGCDDYQSVIEYAAALKLGKERAQLLVQIGKAIIVAILSLDNVMLRQGQLVEECPKIEYLHV